MRAIRRVVLVMPRTGDVLPQTLQATLDEIAGLGWTVAAVIDPAQHLDALRMILDGVADVAVAVQPEHMPTLRLAGYLTTRSAGSVRTQRLPRPECVRTGPGGVR